MASDLKGAALALHRFGLGPRANSISVIASDPRGALLAELDRPRAGQIENSNLRTSGAANRAVFENNARRLAEQKLSASKKRDDSRGAEEPAMEAASKQKLAKKKDPPPLQRQIFLEEAGARIDAAVIAEIGFVERLVWFWSNHFCISVGTTVMAGAYEREAIRPHVLGRFREILLAAEGHPGMLIYLNNQTSMGPNSIAGVNNTRGLNENLAREILELHTLGVRTVYTQADVTNFAKVLTGWTIMPTATNPAHGGEFQFHPRMHEPGPQLVIGTTYPDTGVEQGRAVLADLARHPATAKNVAFKLARHFVADDPPSSLVDRLAGHFLETEGDLKEMATALVNSPEAWTEERRKVKRPGEWLIGAIRATGLRGSPERMTQTMLGLGEPLWQPPAPKGFSDDSAAWLDGLGQRLIVANAFAQRVFERVIDPVKIVDVALGSLASAETRQAIARAESKPQALALLLLSPEFQRR
jgi:uncharacterized protein (DUF1800 family)